MKKQILSALATATLLAALAPAAMAQNVAIVNGKAIPKARDAEAASMGLHGLKGSTGFLAPDGTAHALCSDLEKVTVRGDWARADADWPALEVALRALAEPN